MMPGPATNQYFQVDPAFVLVPVLAIFITVTAFNLSGTARDTLDPLAR
jgi:peptide/nickel transport system permease protein